MHEMDISTLVFDVSAFCEAFLRICVLNTLLLSYTLYLYSTSNAYLLLLGIASSLGINQAGRIPRGPQIVMVQVSQSVHPKVHSERMWGHQGSDPPAFPYLRRQESWLYSSSIAMTGMSASVCPSPLKCMLCHRRFSSPPLHDAKTMAVDPVMYM